MSTTCEDTKKYMNQEISHDNMRLTTYIESKQLKTERAKKFPLCVLTTTMPTRSGRDYTIPKSPESPKDGKNPIPPLRQNIILKPVKLRIVEWSHKIGTARLFTREL